MVKELKLEIAKLRRDKYGISSERRARLIDQLELQLEDLEATATEDALAAEQAAAQDKTSTVRAFTRRKPVRKPFPEHLPRERVVIEAPTSCTCCGSDRIVKMGEDSEPLMRSPVVAPSVRARWATVRAQWRARRWRSFPASGRSSRRCARSTRGFARSRLKPPPGRFAALRTGAHPAAVARRSASRQRHSMSSRVAGPGPA